MLAALIVEAFANLRHPDRQLLPGLLRLMLRDQPIQLGDALALGGVLREAPEAAGGPQGLAFGFELLGVEVGH